ncbi:MAG TPA: DinB family protein [Anaerolineales bacterium]|nr:DinB family protein [Anaerolineales bacterium]
MPTRSQIFKKDQLISNLIETRQKILAAASELSDAEKNQVFLGIWSVKDLLAHLIGWDHTNVAAAKSILNSEIPSFYEHRDRDWQTYNAMLVKEYKRDSLKELLANRKDSHEKLVAYLQTIPPEHFNKDFGVRFRGYKVTIQRLLEAEIKDEQIHLQQMANFFHTSK